MKAAKREWWNRTGAQIAEICGVTRAAVSLWVKSGAPKLGRDSYDMRLVVPWVIEMHRQRNTATLVEAQTRWTNCKADISTVELATLNGTMVDSEAVKAIWDKHISAAKTQLLSIPSRVAITILACKSPEEVQEALDREIRDSLDELAGRGNDSGDRSAGTKRLSQRRTKTGKGKR
jgi:phage terminase Nu1 subunit (DNA packaging protein)